MLSDEQSSLNMKILLLDAVLVLNSIVGNTADEHKNSEFFLYLYHYTICKVLTSNVMREPFGV